MEKSDKTYFQNDGNKALKLHITQRKTEKDNRFFFQMAKCIIHLDRFRQ